MQHIIKKQIIHLFIDRKLDAFRMQHLVSGHYWHEVVPALEKLFDEVSHEHEIIYIDKMEIDLGTITEREISRQPWSEVLLSVITEQFREKLTTGPSGSEPMLRVQSKSAGICQQWLFYIQHGYLPWNILQIDEAWKHQVLEALAIDVAAVASLRKLLPSHPDASGRIIQQHTEAFVVQLTEILTSVNQQSLPLLLNELELLFHALLNSPTGLPDMQQASLRNTLWKHILEYAAAHERKTDTTALVQSILEKYLGHPAVLPSIIKEATASFTMLLPMIKAWEKKTSLSGIKQDTASPEEKDTASMTIQDEEMPLDEEGIFVQNAGVVLLHPFLSTFFNRLQLIQEGQFVHVKAQQKALYLLHYLAAGEITAEEYALVMPKVLCAYPLQKSVSRHSLFTEEETEEADHLLKEVIRQWEMLKSTSPAGFREGFLQRSGKLFSKYDNLYLQVETNTIDVLLDYLPWNLSIIKLPWLQKLLRVEWR